MVRIVVLVLVFVAGSGLAAYVAAWIILPRQDEHRSIARRELNDPRELRLLPGGGHRHAGDACWVSRLWISRCMGTFAWPVLLGVAGMLMVWRGCGPEERAHLRQLIGSAPLLSAPFRRRADGRSSSALVAGAALVAVGLGGLASAAPRSGVAALAFLGAVAVIAGFLLVFGPWWLRMFRELTEERRERLRAEERADMAAHVHDSVLQTLALIQKSAGDPAEVTRLARRPGARAPVLAVRGRPSRCAGGRPGHGGHRRRRASSGRWRTTTA